MNERAIEQANERATAAGICRLLDEGTAHLPWRVTERLAAARAQALARVIPPAPVRVSGASQARSAGTAVPRPAPRLPADGGSAALGWSLRRRIVSTALPIALMLAGFVMIDIAQQEQSANDLLEVDSALLTDEVPLVAYADRGFGVFIKNTRQ
ncbi:MAG: DUF3619 family protein [Lautropia sp.]